MIGKRPLPDRCLSNLLLDRMLGSELAGRELDSARSHLHECPRCQARLTAFEAERDQFRRTALFAQRPRPLARCGLPSLLLGAAGALGAAAVALLLLPHPPAPQPLESPDVRTKGGIRLGVYVKRGEQVSAAADGTVVRAGDAVRFAYSSPAAGYVAVLGRDGSGRVSVYFPDGEKAAPFGPSVEEPLPGSIVLDNAPGPEVIQAVRCRTPVVVARLVEELRAGEVAAPIGCAVDRVVLDKSP